MHDLPSQRQEDGLDCALTRPVGEDGQSIVVDAAVCLDAWEVDLGEELDLGRRIWIAGAAVNAERIDAVLEDRVARSDDCRVPIRHHCFIEERAKHSHAEGAKIV